MSPVLIIAPPTMMSEAPASTYSPAFSAVMPPATATGMDTSAMILFRTSTGGSSPLICVSMPMCMQMYDTPRASTCLARATLSGTLIMSTMTSAPYFLPARTASSIVASSASPRTVTMSAPALAMISTSKDPVSIVLVSAMIFFPGNSLFSVRTASAPSLLISGVPASIQSAPPSTASRAIATALFSCIRSKAT